MTNIGRRLGLAAMSVSAVATLTLIATTAAAAGPKGIKAPSTYPITISTSGSYVLTENLVLSAAGPKGIVVTASDVTIDFDGFSLRTPTGGSQPGIYASSDVSNVIVKNGIVSGFGGDGINLGEYSSVQNMHVGSNGGDGIAVGSGSSITGCLSHNNGGFGLNFADNTGSYTDDLVFDNTAGTVQNGIPAGGNVCNGSTTCP